MNMYKYLTKMRNLYQGLDGKIIHFLDRKIEYKTVAPITDESIIEAINPLYLTKKERLFVLRKYDVLSSFVYAEQAQESRRIYRLAKRGYVSAREKMKSLVRKLVTKRGGGN